MYCNKTKQKMVEVNLTHRMSWIENQDLLYLWLRKITEFSIKDKYYPKVNKIEKWITLISMRWRAVQSVQELKTSSWTTTKNWMNEWKG